MARTTSNQILKNGQAAPDFALQGVDHKIHSLADYTNSKMLLVVFICNHCPYVKARIGDIKDLQTKFTPSELQIISINSNDPSYEQEGFENMIEFARDYHINFPYLIDHTQEVAKIYGAVCTPDPFLFDSSRKLIFHGRINDALEPEMMPKIQVMENNIRKALKGETIEREFDPSVGCSIKWKN
jgi:peroxiredoxin